MEGVVNQKVLSYSSSPALWPYLASPLPAMMTSQATLDTNGDGLPDQLLCNLTFRADPSQVTQVNIIYLLDLQTSGTVKIQAQTLAILQLSSSQGIAAARVTGSLRLHQKVPLYQNDFSYLTYNSSVLLGPQQTVLPTLGLITENSFRRNISLSVMPMSPEITPAKDSGSSESISIQVNLHIPP